jgi:hypothetical protein
MIVQYANRPARGGGMATHPLDPPTRSWLSAQDVRLFVRAWVIGFIIVLLVIG